MNPRRTLMIGALALVAIGLAVRLWHILAEPLWLDEAYSAYAAGHGFAFLWQVVPRYETHPPFYYSLLRLWTLAFGDGLAALRALGVIAGLATVPVIAWGADEAARWLGWEADRRRRARFAAFALACLAIPLVEMTRQVRPYPLMILVYAAACGLLLRLGRRRGEGRPLGGRAFAAWLVLVELILWLHNMGPLYAVALTLGLGLALLGRGVERGEWLWLAGGYAMVALAYLPGLLILLDQAPTWVGSTWLRFGFASLGEHLQMLYAAPGWPCLAALLLAGLGLAAGRRPALLLALLALAPVLLSVAISLALAPVFITRTMTPVAAPALILFALGAAAWRDAKRWLGLGGALILGANMLAVDLQARAAGPMQDWYGTVDWLRQRFRPGDQVFAYPNEGALPLSYALRDAGLFYPIRSIPAPVPAFDAGGWHPTGSRGVVSLPRQRLRAIAEEPATRAVSTIWLLRLGAETYDPGDAFLRELRRGRRVVRSWKDGPIDIVGLARASSSGRTAGTGRSPAPAARPAATE